MKKILESIFRHSAGATVSHRSKFSKLEVPTTENQLDEEFCRKWVSPFYMSHPIDEFFQDQYIEVHSEIDSEIITKLLTEFNWRTRIVGAYFAGIKEFKEFESFIGKLLLRSDVCFAGTGYCYALAMFNTDKSIEYLEEYLQYYLKKKHLWFDQNTCMAAVNYLDEINNTNHMGKHLPAWKKFVKNKPYWDLNDSIEGFKKSINALREIQNKVKDK